MLQHPLKRSRLWRHPCAGAIPATFKLTEACAGIHRQSHALLSRAAISPAATHLWWQIVSMGVHIALGSAIGLQLFKCREPAINFGMLLAQCKSLEVGERRIHPLHVGNEHKVGGTRNRTIRCIRVQPATFTADKRLLHLQSNTLELITSLKFLTLSKTWST